MRDRLPRFRFRCAHRGSKRAQKRAAEPPFRFHIREARDYIASAVAGAAARSAS
jgi:hypothetical protein